MISQDRTIALVWEKGATIEGFIIANIIPAPPVYEPGGPTCLVDDYWVRGGRAWDTIGRGLLERVSIEAKSRFGAAQILVVCGQKDNAKRTMLQNQDLQIASDWYVKGLH